MSFIYPTTDYVLQAVVHRLVALQVVALLPLRSPAAVGSRAGVPALPHPAGTALGSPAVAVHTHLRGIEAHTPAAAAHHTAHTAHHQAAVHGTAVAAHIVGTAAVGPAGIAAAGPADSAAAGRAGAVVD